MVFKRKGYWSLEQPRSSLMPMHEPLEEAWPDVLSGDFQ